MDNKRLNEAVLESFPMLVAPVGESISNPQQPGTRFIASSQGLVREVSTEWLLHRKLIAPANLPYGQVQTGFALLKKAPRSLWREFIDQARTALPNECAAVFVLNTMTGTWRLAMREETFTSRDRCDYIEPDIGGDEIKVVDIHSHGHAPAFFSTIDDLDDSGGLKVAAVVGNVSSERPQVAIRLVVLDEFVPLSLAEDGSFKEKT